MKHLIRKKMLAQRNGLTPEEKHARDKALIKHIQQDINYQQAQTVALFYPMASEIDLRPLLNDQHTFLFPKVCGKNMIFYVYDQHTKWVKSKFGVLEPDEAKPFHEQIDYMLAPALAVDLLCNRIGYGKGYYDRYLQVNRPKTVIGVVYDFQVIDHIEVTLNDQKLDGYLKG